MTLQSITLTNFRSFEKQRFDFDSSCNLIIGPNTSGKSNILEAIYFLAIGKSLRADSQKEVIRIGSGFAKIQAKIDTGVSLEIVISENPERYSQAKKNYKINNVQKTRYSFLGNFSAVHFSPADIRLVIGSPARRRDVLDQILSQADRHYLRALLSYQKTVSQKNKLLKSLQDHIGDVAELDFWNESQEKFGKYLQETRAKFIEFSNLALVEIAPKINSLGERLEIFYKDSLISKDKLNAIKKEEIAKAVCLIGPHRDDYSFIKNSAKDLELYGSRGEQRTAVFALKLCEIGFLEQSLHQTPMLLLDDIFSELDKSHRERIFEVLGSHQSIITTAERALVPEEVVKNAKIFEI